jgi:hypothetical protein
MLKFHKFQIQTQHPNGNWHTVSSYQSESERDRELAARQEKYKRTVYRAFEE